MYVDPLAIYREYVQNAADSIDEARETGVLPECLAGLVAFSIDLETRTVRIRDNGVGVPAAEFIERLTAFGASQKRGQSARGFRGVGRLAGIGYCQELVLRSRAAGESTESELRWDCRRLKQLLVSEDRHRQLSDIVIEAVAARQAPTEVTEGCYFEVELRGIVRHQNDRLLDAAAINAYLSQVGPVPFAPEFQYGASISRALAPRAKLGEIEIWLPGLAKPVYRPYRDYIEVGGGKTDRFRELEMLTVPGMDGGVAAIGWVLHHGYSGALPGRTLQKGLRLRLGDIQVGDERLLEEVFSEPRFNSWCVGELHILDTRIVPNGRRDDFEHNTHYLNVLSHLAPLARELSKRCRSSSIQRNRLRECGRQIEVAKEKLAIVKQGAVGKAEQNRLLRDVLAGIAEAERLAGGESVGSLLGEELGPVIAKLKREVAKALGRGNTRTPLGHLPRGQRQHYEQIFALIYECAPNRNVAKAIVDRVIRRL
jgi:molecular chaperone HtpG